jgi:hypothetical protein
MATQPQPTPHPEPKPPHPDDEAKAKEARVAEARKIFDEYEKEEPPMTTQTDGIRRSMDMERVGAENYMRALEDRIKERQGEAPPEPRQVHGVAPVKPPTH